MSKGALVTAGLFAASLATIGYHLLTASWQAAEPGPLTAVRQATAPAKPAEASPAMRIDWRGGEALNTAVSVRAPWPLDVREVSLRHAREAMAWLVSQGPADYYVVTAHAPVRDGLGNTPVQRVLELKLPAATAARINWQGITETELVAACIRDGAFEMHPALSE